MKNIFIVFLVVTLTSKLSAQSTDTNYALPSDATEVSNNVSNTPGFMLTLSEGGTVPSESKSTCDGETMGAIKSSTGFSLQHYYDKQQLQQMSAAYASMGGMKSMFVKSMEEKYNNYENGMQPGPIQKKGKLETGELQGAVVSYFIVTYGCVQEDTKTTTATKVIYDAMLLTDTDYLLITNEVYSANIDKGKKYTEEIISKVKKLDHGKVN